MADLSLPPFRDMPPVSGIEKEDSRFTPKWEEWFIKNRNQINENIADIAALDTRVTNIEAKWATVFHVGCLIETTNSANPSTYMGFGTWALYGTGRFTVCLNSADADFDTVSETGGSKSTEVLDHKHTLSGHTHTGPAHVHTIDHTHGVGTDIGSGANVSAGFAGNSGSAGTGDTGTPSVDETGDAGASGSLSILPPYIVVYRWRRTA